MSFIPLYECASNDLLTGDCTAFEIVEYVEYLEQPSTPATIEFPIEQAFPFGSPEYFALLGATAVLLASAYIVKPAIKVMR